MEEKGLKLTILGALLIVGVVVVAILLLSTVLRPNEAKPADAPGAGS